jgi:hypothetical protein
MHRPDVELLLAHRQKLKKWVMSHKVLGLTLL